MLKRSSALSCLTLVVIAASSNAFARGDDHAKGRDQESRRINRAPGWLVAPVSTYYDGLSDDLLTAGLGKTGLGGAAPVVTDPNDPAQLRRLAIWTNYRAILDITPGGGYGRLYGPNVAIDGNVTTSEGKIAGAEWIAYADDEGEGANVTMMVQIPGTFDPGKACIVTGASSGSRGVYGAIRSSGEWGLKHGCAVDYTDKGTGNGIHDLSNNTVNLRNGVRADADVAGSASNFTAPISAAERQQFDATTPNRIAVKHAHSQLNPEADWARDTLRSIEFAFWALNEQFGTPTPSGSKRVVLHPDNTIVIASSVSNGAGAALAAAEEDDRGLIHGVAVAEPNIQVRPGRAFTIQRGTLPPYTAGSRPLFDYFTWMNLYEPCAALAPRASTAAQPFPAAFVPLAQARCTSLAERGLFSTTSLAAQSDEALDKLLAFGMEPDTINWQVSHWRFAVPAIVLTYANTYGRFSVLDRLCGFGFAFTNASGFPIAPNTAALATVFGTGNGIPPTAGINIVNELSVGGAKLDTLSISPSTNRLDFNLDGAVCQRELFTGTTGDADRVREGIEEVQRSADLNGKPAIIVHGRSDTLLPVNFTSRSYLAANRLEEGARSNVRYIEVTNAQHFDAFLPFPDYANRLVPLHVYFIRALDAMYEHLTTGAALPASQVVRTMPRGSAAIPLSATNVPKWSATPPATDQIIFSGSTLTIPD